MKKTFAPTTLATCLLGASLTMLVACTATTGPTVAPATKDAIPASTKAAAPAAAPAAVAPAAATPIVSFTSATTTAQGGSVDAFSYSEKPGDATLGNVSFTNGAVRATGKLGAEKGSTWGGIGLIAGVAAGEKTVNIAGKTNLRIKLASATASTLRVRIMSTDKATRDNGCYPVAVQKVTAELTEYSIPLSSFAPEAYCAAMGRSISAVSGAVASIEVSDPTVPSKSRNVDFTVGSVGVQP